MSEVESGWGELSSVVCTSSEPQWANKGAEGCDREPGLHHLKPFQGYLANHSRRQAGQDVPKVVHLVREHADRPPTLRAQLLRLLTTAHRKASKQVDTVFSTHLTIALHDVGQLLVLDVPHCGAVVWDKPAPHQ